VSVRSLMLCFCLMLSVAAFAQAPISSSARVFVQKSQTQTHAFDVDVQAPRPFELVSVSVKDAEGTWGRFSIVNDPPSPEIGFKTASFRFLPARYEIEVELDYGDGVQVHKAGPFTNQIQKLVIVDRDGYPQRALMIEGDRWFLFGRLAASSEISTGLVKYGGTPLGYYHVRNKEAHAYNAKQEWDMYMAQWYTPSSYPEGVNGLHQGFEGTNYGIRQSHGCTRMPDEFTKQLWDWTEMNTPVIFMGTEYQTSYDRGRFDTEVYRYFDSLIRDMVYYHQSLGADEENRTCFNDAEVQQINRLVPFQNAVLDACANYSRFSMTEGYSKVVDQFIQMRKLQ